MATVKIGDIRVKPEDVVLILSSVRRPNYCVVRTATGAKAEVYERPSDVFRELGEPEHLQQISGHYVSVEPKHVSIVREDRTPDNVARDARRFCCVFFEGGAWVGLDVGVHAFEDMVEERRVFDRAFDVKDVLIIVGATPTERNNNSHSIVRLADGGIVGCKKTPAEAFDAMGEPDHLLDQRGEQTNDPASYFSVTHPATIRPDRREPDNDARSHIDYLINPTAGQDARSVSLAVNSTALDVLRMMEEHIKEFRLAQVTHSIKDALAAARTIFYRGDQPAPEPAPDQAGARRRSQTLGTRRDPVKRAPRS